MSWNIGNHQQDQLWHHPIPLWIDTKIWDKSRSFLSCQNSPKNQFVFFLGIIFPQILLEFNSSHPNFLLSLWEISQKNLSLSLADPEIFFPSPAEIQGFSSSN